jgi:hypothetical protein
MSTKASRTHLAKLPFVAVLLAVAAFGSLFLASRSTLASPWEVCSAPDAGTGDPRGTHYGPFSVKSDNWYSSGAQVMRGDIFTVQATGYFVATTDGTHIGPGGGGVWDWWELVAQIGTWRTYAPGGTYVAGADGALEFGVPRAIQSTSFVEDDIKLLSGALTVEVWVKAP